MKPLNTDDQSALLCAASIVLQPTATNELMYMPGGIHKIMPFAGGVGQPIEVLVDAQAALELETQRVSLVAKGKNPYFDFEHEDAGASFWPSSFYWRDLAAPGIYCRGEWTDDGRAGVDGKKWRKFSPVFHVDNKRAKPARIVCKRDAVPNMGGLVNNPAFQQISPLWAKNAPGAQSGNQTETYMNPEDMKALQDKITELEAEIARLKGEQSAAAAKGHTDDLVASKIEAKQAQLRATANELELTQLKAKSAQQEGEILAQRKANATAVVKSAVERGAIAARDAETIAAWEKDITEDPARGALLAKMQGNPALSGIRMTASFNNPASITAEAPGTIMREYSALVAKNAAIPLSHATAKEKGDLARSAAAIFAADIDKNPSLLHMTMDEAIKATSFDPNANLGLLAGSLALQRALPLMLTQLPLLGAISTDFSDEPGVLNQATITRIVLKPAVQTYDQTLGASGRPNGWTNASPAQTVDVEVRLDAHVGIPLVFGAGNINSTTRNLFEEQAPMAINALGEFAVGRLSELMTPANFNAYRGIALAGGATTNGSPTVTVTSTAAAYAGQRITGTGIPANTLIASITNGTTLVLSRNATATGTGLTLTLTMSTGKVTTTYATYVRTLAAFAVADMDSLAAAFDNNDVPMTDRFAALSPSFYRKLGSDAAVNALMQGTGDARYLTERMLPKVSNFEMLNSPWFPQTANRTGFVGHKAALVLKARLPGDHTTALPGVSFPGSVTTITDPGSGLTMMLTQYYDPTGGYAEWRPEILLGAAVGDRRAGLVVTSS